MSPPPSPSSSNRKNSRKKLAKRKEVPAVKKPVDIETRPDDPWVAEATIILYVDDLEETVHRLAEQVTRDGFREGGIVRIQMQNLTAYASGAHMKEPYRSYFARRMQEEEKLVA